MNTDSTTSLLNILNQTHIDDLDEFLADHQFSNSASEHFSKYFSTHDIKASAIVKECQGYISKSYIYDILSGKKTNPSRDNVILICLAAHMDLKMTKRTLEIFGHRPLYPKDNRDAIIAICINNKVYDIANINDRLFEHEEKLFLID